jgi:hypothetical protein
MDEIVVVAVNGIDEGQQRRCGDVELAGVLSTTRERGRR